MPEKTFVEWIGGTRTVGPNREIAIQNGEVRELLSQSNGRAFLAGRNRMGVYGSVSVSDFQVLTEKDIRDKRKLS